MKSVLISFFNSNNIGDRAIGDNLYTLVSNFSNVVKLSYSGSLCASGVFSENKKKKGYKVIILNALERIGLSSVLYFYYKYLKKINLNHLEKIIIEADVLIIGGGNMIFDLNKYSLSACKFDKFISVAKKHKKDIFAISLGIGPFQSLRQEKEAIKALSKCDYISFRDKSSYDIYRKHNQVHTNVYLSNDPVFLLPQKVFFESNRNSCIAFNVINNKLISNSKKKYSSSIVQYVKLLEALSLNSNKKIVLFSTEIADYSAINNIYDLLKSNKNIEIRYIKNLNELIYLYGETSVVIATRMHAMIIALTQRIPIIGFSWQKKVESLFNLFESEDSIFSYEKIAENITKIISCVDRKNNTLEFEQNKINNTLKKLNNSVDIDVLRKLNSKFD